MGAWVTCEKRMKMCRTQVYSRTYEDIPANANLADFRQSLLLRFDLAPDFVLICRGAIIDSQSSYKNAWKQGNYPIFEVVVGSVTPVEVPMTEMQEKFSHQVFSIFPKINPTNKQLGIMIGWKIGLTINWKSDLIGGHECRFFDGQCWEIDYDADIIHDDVFAVFRLKGSMQFGNQSYFKLSYDQCKNGQGQFFYQLGNSIRVSPALEYYAESSSDIVVDNFHHYSNLVGCPLLEEGNKLAGIVYKETGKILKSRHIVKWLRKIYEENKFQSLIRDIFFVSEIQKITFKYWPSFENSEVQTPHSQEISPDQLGPIIFNEFPSNDFDGIMSPKIIDNASYQDQKSIQSPIQQPLSIPTLTCDWHQQYQPKSPAPSSDLQALAWGHMVWFECLRQQTYDIFSQSGGDSIFYCVKCSTILEILSPEDFVRSIYGEDFDTVFAQVQDSRISPMPNLDPKMVEIRLQQETIPELYEAVMHQPEVEAHEECGYQHDESVQVVANFAGLSKPGCMQLDLNLQGAQTIIKQFQQFFTTYRTVRGLWSLHLPKHENWFLKTMQDFGNQACKGFGIFEGEFVWMEQDDEIFGVIIKDTPVSVIGNVVYLCEYVLGNPADVPWVVIDQQPSGNYFTDGRLKYLFSIGQVIPRYKMQLI